jgi:hypothetical protein
MPTQEERPSLRKRSLEDITATQAEHTLFLARIVEHLEEMRSEQNNHTRLLNDHIALLNDHTALLNQILDKLDKA